MRLAPSRRVELVLHARLALLAQFALVAQLALVALLALVPTGCSRASDEESARRAVRSFAEHLERGRVGRAVALLAEDFRLEGWGWDRADVRRELDLRIRLLRRTGDGGFRISLEPEDYDVIVEGEGGDVVVKTSFDAAVFGGAIPTEVEDPTPLERLRVDAELRRVDGRIRFTTARVR